MKLFLCTLGLIFFSNAYAARESATYVLCKSEGNVRTIRVINDGSTCSTAYSKLGVEQVVGKARAVVSCKNILTNIRTNLEKAAWKCQDISGSKITASPENAQQNSKQ